MPSLQYLVIEWLIPLVMVPFVARRRRPFPAIAWLGFIFAVPLFGVVLYLLIGEYGLRRRRRGHRSPDPLEAGGRIDPATLFEPSRTVATAIDGLARDRDMPAPILTARSVELMQDTDAVDRLVEDIAAARDHVHLLFFIYADDDTGWRVAHAMAEAAGRGVACRLLVDAHGSKKARRSIGKWLEQRGVRVERSLRISPLQNPVRRVDVRNHRKVAVIDGVIGYTGSMNIHDSDYELDEGCWSQITARIAGAAVARLQQVFIHDWHMAAEQHLQGDNFYPDHPEGDIAVQILEDGPSYACDSIQPALIEMIQTARERVTVTTPYFVPDEAMRLALRLAALRGVRVDLFVPRASDRGLADAAARAMFAELLNAGVHIHRHGPGVLHAKTITVDDSIAMTGTANLDYRSFFLNYEVVMMAYDPATAIMLRTMQQSYSAACESLDCAAWERRSKWERARDDVAKLFSPLL